VPGGQVRYSIKSAWLTRNYLACRSLCRVAQRSGTVNPGTAWRGRIGDAPRDTTTVSTNRFQYVTQQTDD
jgi:hypothetical protein